MLKLILIHGSIYSTLLGLALTAVLLKNPRLMLQDYPPELQAMVPAKTLAEKKATYVYGLPFLLILILYPVVSTIVLRATMGWQFWNAFAYAGGLALFGNLFDLLICDWLVFCYITPSFVVLDGTEQATSYKNYYFHFKGFLKGLLFVAITAFVAAGLAEWLA